MLGSESDADDVLQDVFVRAMRYGQNFDGRNPLGWLYRISDRQCIDTIRRRRRMEPVGDLDKQTDSGPADGDSAASVIRGFRAREIISAVKPKDAEVAILYYVDEMSQDEVASAMGCSRKMVRKRLARFREAAARLNERA